jgi:hypothetical protein
VTLVLSWIDQQHVVHVADRRISFDRGNGRFEPRDDDTRKIFLAGGTLVVSFAGLAELAPRLSTIDWLRQRMSDASQAGVELDAALQQVAAELTALTGRRREFRKQPLMINLSGWVISEADALTPVVGTVTNIAPDNTLLPAFTGLARELPYNGGWQWNGTGLTRAAQVEVHRLLRRGTRRGISPYVIADIFLRAVRQTHKANSLVGPTALVAILPRSAVDHGRTRGFVDELWGDDAKVLIGQVMLIEVPANRERLERFWPVGD